MPPPTKKSKARASAHADSDNEEVVEDRPETLSRTKSKLVASAAEEEEEVIEEEEVVEEEEEEEEVEVEVDADGDVEIEDAEAEAKPAKKKPAAAEAPKKAPPAAVASGGKRKEPAPASTTAGAKKGKPTAAAAAAGDEDEDEEEPLLLAPITRVKTKPRSVVSFTAQGRQVSLVLLVLNVISKETSKAGLFRNIFNALVLSVGKGTGDLNPAGTARRKGDRETDPIEFSYYTPEGLEHMLDAGRFHEVKDAEKKLKAAFQRGEPSDEVATILARVSEAGQLDESVGAFEVGLNDIITFTVLSEALTNYRSGSIVSSVSMHAAAFGERVTLEASSVVPISSESITFDDFAARFPLETNAQRNRLIRSAPNPGITAHVASNPTITFLPTYPDTRTTATADKKAAPIFTIVFLHRSMPEGALQTNIVMFTMRAPFLIEKFRCAHFGPFARAMERVPAYFVGDAGYPSSTIDTERFRGVVSETFPEEEELVERLHEGFIRKTQVCAFNWQTFFDLGLPLSLEALWMVFTQKARPGTSAAESQKFLRVAASVLRPPAREEWPTNDEEQVAYLPTPVGTTREAAFYCVCDNKQLTALNSVVNNTPGVTARLFCDATGLRFDAEEEQFATMLGELAGSGSVQQLADGEGFEVDPVRIQDAIQALQSGGDFAGSDLEATLSSAFGKFVYHREDGQPHVAAMFRVPLKAR